MFIVTRFKEHYSELGDVNRSVIEAMDTSGRAILLAGTTVVIALLGMFATGVSFMYGLAVAAVIAVLCVLAASLTLLPAILSRWGARIVRPRGKRGGCFVGASRSALSRAGALVPRSRPSRAVSRGGAGARWCRRARGRSRSSLPR